MNRSYVLGEDFENIVRGYYLQEGFEFVEPNPKVSGYDFSVRSPGKETIVVEVKVFRTRVVQRSDIVQAVMNLEAARSQVGANKGTLFISSAIAIPVTGTGLTELVDVNGLAKMVLSYPELALDLDKLMRELAPLPSNDFDIDLKAYVFGDAHLAMRQGADRQPQGAILATALKGVSAGKNGARAFEDKCLDALQYIFENHLTNWSKQKLTDGGVSRYDAIARISSEHDFWKSIIAYFKTWYVVFEFKNHTQKITQGQIYTTEKYLFAGAMRTVAFIISRKGADKNALAATRGAVRESGKLIIHFSIDDICKMLEAKDSGDDPNSTLFDSLDEMLMKLER